jgi:hypothetical protein
VVVLINDPHEMQSYAVTMMCFRAFRSAGVAEDKTLIYTSGPPGTPNGTLNRTPNGTIRRGNVMNEFCTESSISATTGQ